MWPYNYCEWKNITYGITRKHKDYKKLNKYGLILASVVPSILMIGLLALLLTK